MWENAPRDQEVAKSVTDLVSQIRHHGHQVRWADDLNIQVFTMKKFLFAVCASALFSVPALACEAPASKPEIPDPTTAATAQMVKTNNEVKQYVQAKETYLGCAKMSSREKRQALEELEAYADSFNQAVRTFKMASN